MSTGPSTSFGALVDLLAGKWVLVLTGAGCSTESGIPDYRGPETRRRAHKPMQYRDFVGSDAGRARYWARSVFGWPRFREAQPNAAHEALATLEDQGIVTALVTQNVDRLHRRAGSRRVIELHGALADVICLGCGAREDRDALQARLLALNPGFRSTTHTLRPDGDAEVTPDVASEFRVAGCAACGGVLKPDVVFFGENVPRARVNASYEHLDAADALLVVGSSLAVFSGYRFVLRAVARGMPAALVNLGESRGDTQATVRVEARAGELLPRLVGALLWA